MNKLNYWRILYRKDDCVSGTYADINWIRFRDENNVELTGEIQSSGHLEFEEEGTYFAASNAFT